MFLAPANGDFHLTASSPEIDSGDNAAPDLPIADLDGKPRILDATGKGYAIVDREAYEFTGVAGGHTIETLQSSLNPSTFGTPVTFTAQLTSSAGVPTGTVQFTDGTSPLSVQPISATGASVYTTGSLAAGSHTITANYQPAASFPAATASLIQVVTGDPTTTALACTPSTVAVFSPTLLSAGVSSSSGIPSGTITFADNGTTLGTAALLNGLATLAYTAQTAGTHTLTVSFTSAGSFNRSAASCSLLVNPSPTTANLVVSPTSGTVGAPLTLTATVSPAALPAAVALTGTVTFLIGGVPLGNASLAGGVASLSLSTLPAGFDQLTCRYSGDSAYAPSSCNTVPVTIAAAPTALTLASSQNPAGALSPVTFTVRVTSGAQPVAGGTVTLTFTPAGAPPIVASLVTDTGGTVSYTTSALTTGSYPISATFATTAGQLSSSASLLETIVPNPTATTLTVSPNPAYQGQTVSLLAIVSTPSGIPIPGSISFLDGAILLAVVPIAQGHATYATALLAPGSHTFTAVYPGSLNLLASASVPVVEPVSPSDFLLAANPTALSLRTGHHTTFTLTATSLGNFADQLQLSMPGLPAHLRLEPGSLSPLVQGGQTTASIYLDTDDVLGYLSRSRSRSAPLRGRSTSETFVATMPGMAMLILAWRRRTRLSALVTILLAAALLSSTVACSGKYPASTAPGSYTLQITVTGTQTQTIHTLAIPLIITK